MDLSQQPAHNWHDGSAEILVAYDSRAHIVNMTPRMANTTATLLLLHNSKVTEDFRASR